MTETLILSDVLMPAQTGPEMVAALPAALAHVPVLFVTGYAAAGEPYCSRSVA